MCTLQCSRGEHSRRRLETGANKRSLNRATEVHVNDMWNYFAPSCGWGVRPNFLYLWTLNVYEQSVWTLECSHRRVLWRAVIEPDLRGNHGQHSRPARAAPGERRPLHHVSPPLARCAPPLAPPQYSTSTICTLFAFHWSTEHSLMKVWEFNYMNEFNWLMTNEQFPG